MEASTDILVVATAGESPTPFGTGSHDSSRRREPVRQIARCQKCKLERMGTTTFESMAWGGHPVGHAVHFCDECAASIVERPLEDVLSDLTEMPVADILGAALSAE